MNKINNFTLKEAKERAYKLGFEGESNRRSCCQACFNAISETLGIKNSLIFKCVSALGGGGGTCDGSCGVYSAGLVVFSYFFGRDYELWEKCMTDRKASDLGQKLYKRFIDSYGSIICKDIQIKKFGRRFNFNIITAEEKELFEKMGAHKDVCTRVVGLGAVWAVEILWEEIPKDKDISKIKSLEII
jgi:C_GCAxxG_C_C family probable redox protein